MKTATEFWTHFAIDTAKKARMEKQPLPEFHLDHQLFDAAQSEVWHLTYWADLDWPLPNSTYFELAGIKFHRKPDRMCESASDSSLASASPCETASLHTPAVT